MAEIIQNIGHHAVSKHTSFRLYNVFVVVAMSFGSIAMGYSGSIIGTILAQPTFLEYFELETRSNGTSLISSMNGLFQAGCFFGSVAISFVADHYGRKTAIAIPALLVVISGALLAGSVNIAMFLVFRFVAGAGSFMLLGAVPMWMTEVVPRHNRGLLVDIHSAALLLGYALASWAGYGFFHYKNENAWRGPLALQCVPALIVLICIYWLPESPRYLIQCGRHEDARVVLSKLHTEEEAQIEFTQIEETIRQYNALPHSWLSLITKASYRKRALFGIGLACGIQFTGVLVINNYSSIIYKGLGFSNSTILLYQGIFNTIAWVCGIVAMFIIDLFPRNKLVTFGIFMVTSCLTVEAALVANFPVGPDQNNAALRAAAAMTFLYIGFAQLFLDGTQYVYYTELFPNNLRGKGMTLGIGAISLMNIMWLQAAPTAFEKISWKFYLCFIIPAYLFGIVAFFFYPDTKGRSLEELSVMFGDDNGENTPSPSIAQSDHKGESISHMENGGA